MAFKVQLRSCCRELLQILNVDMSGTEEHYKDRGTRKWRHYTVVWDTWTWKVGVWQARHVLGRQNKLFCWCWVGTGKKGLISLRRRKGEYKVCFMLLIDSFRERIGLDKLGWRMIVLDKHQNILYCVEINVNKKSWVYEVHSSLHLNFS